MLRKIDKAMGVIWLMVLPMIISGLIILTARFLYQNYEEVGVTLLNVSCLVGLIIIAGWVISTFLSFGSWVKGKIRDAKLAKYYKEHPEAEKRTHMI